MQSWWITPYRRQKKQSKSSERVIVWTAHSLCWRCSLSEIDARAYLLLRNRTMGEFASVLSLCWGKLCAVELGR